MINETYIMGVGPNILWRNAEVNNFEAMHSVDIQAAIHDTHLFTRCHLVCS